MSYQSIDGAIRGWAAMHGFTLFDAIENSPEAQIRCVYISGEHGECFQIWVQQPESGEVSIHGAGVETKDNEELRHALLVPEGSVISGLDSMLAEVRRWIHR